MSRTLSPPPTPVVKTPYIGQEFDNFRSFKTVMPDWTLSSPRKVTLRKYPTELVGMGVGVAVSGAGP